MREAEFAIFNRFSRALSHIVRGDLSVITNEVSYLASKLPSQELDRVKNRCMQIAVTISKVAGMQSEVELEPINLEQVALSFGCTEVDCGDVRVAADSVKIERFAVSLRQILPQLVGACVINKIERGELATISFTQSNYPGQGARYQSWSSFAASELGERSVIDAVVCDLIARAHGWRIEIEAASELRCQLIIPIVV